ncbi:TetR/AcrR family transcriptional regulator [Deinococcus sp. HMF7604]|uniref:TetR/AcrR family transcriptional regulator n=1 Tax=Deinococcus betulae TaxID=2873312 RepID=UPI001CCA1945|nr:TetR/AcrR family transcriptional regulator [Deinococcus betulae]
MSAHSKNRKGKPRAVPCPPADPERRAAILTAAQNSFAQKGFHRTTMREVARQAGLAEGTLYNHFDNKDALLLGLFEALGEQTRANLTLPTDAPPRQALKAVLSAPLRTLAQDNFALFRVVVSEALVRPELGQQFAALLFEQAAPELGGTPPLPALPTLQALMTGLALHQALRHADPAPDPDALADALSEQVLALLLPEPQEAF